MRARGTAEVFAAVRLRVARGGALRHAGRTFGRAALVCLAMATAPRPAFGILFTFFNADGAGEGFNDPTLGARRQSAFQYALDIWGDILAPSYAGQTITVHAQFSNLGGSGGGALLGQAYSPSVVYDDGTDPRFAPNTWYAAGLANHLAGADYFDAGLGLYEIAAEFNADVDNGTVLGSSDWYYGTDGNVGFNVDFVSVALHEIGHGLGFFSLIDSADGSYFELLPSIRFPSIYDRYLTTGATGGQSLDTMTDAERLAAITSGNLYWDGPQAVAMNGGVRPRIYAPATFAAGSSLSHVDEGTYPGDLMSPFFGLGEVRHAPSAIDIGMLSDMGWTIVPEPSAGLSAVLVCLAYRFSRRVVKKAVVPAAALLLLGGGAAIARQPNMLLIVSDDQGYPDLGCIGTKPVRTPHLDRLAADGVRATQFYVTWPACTPSRGSVLTGRYPQRNGLYDMVRNDLVNYGHRYSAEEYAVSPEMTLGLDPRELTIGDALRRAGYRTGVVGKWDMGQARRYLPLQRGFDFFYGHGNNGIDYYTHERYGIASLFAGNERTEADRGTYATDLFEREALRFVRDADSRPWFLYLAFNAPHGASSFAAEEAVRNDGKKAAVGVQVPDEDARPYRAPGLDDGLARYYGAVTRMDSAIGRIVAQLRAGGTYENTLILFFSDNGGSGNGGNAPLRGKKSTMWEGGLRVPFVAAWPARLPRGVVCDEFLTALEVFPSLLAAAGATPPEDVKLDGFDCLPVLRGERPSARGEMFWQRRGDKAARVGDWKWVESAAGGGLFDLAADVGERHDLSTAKPETAARLRDRWNAWRAEMDAAEPRGPFRDY